MARHCVTVDQLWSKYGDAFMNVDVEDGHISIACPLFKHPVYLLRRVKNDMVTLIIFASQEWADEWLEEYGNFYSSVTKLIEENNHD